MNRPPEHQSVCHRIDTGRYYADRPIHAQAGVHEAVLEILKMKLPEGAQIADLGAGSGALSARLADAGFDVTAVDFELDDLPKNVRAVESDLLADDLRKRFRAQPFDAVVAAEVIEHLSDPLRFLEFCFESLKPGGSVLITTPNISHPYSRLKFLINGRFLLFDEDAYWASGHQMPLSPWMLEQHLRRVGFDSLEYGFAGVLDFTGFRRFVAALTSGIARYREATLGVRGDRSTLLFAAKKPR